ncbi:MAG: SUMF1/EgtB/PvdO family nonheme iron enzyme [Planctomycetaceae bacterium]
MNGPSFENLPDDVLIRINDLCNELEQSWPQVARPIESMVAEIDERYQATVASELIALESELRHSAGECVKASDYVDRFPQLDPATLSILVTSSFPSAPVPNTNTTGEPKPHSEGSSVKSLRRELLDAAICTDSEITQLLSTKNRHDDEKTAVITSLRNESRITSYQADILAGAQPGKLTIGEYTLLEQLGSGGMGRVFKAFHRRMHRVVVIKFLREEFKEDPRYRHRFEREMFASARLKHPNVITAFDAGESDGNLYLVTEFVAARDLSRVVKEDGPLPVAQAVDVIRQTAIALQHTHAQDVIHRDVKPSNLLLESTGVVRLLDLGLSRLTSGLPEQDESSAFGAGCVMGTAEYMAPEQAVGNADTRSDIYGLGCTLFSLLTGRPCYPADTPIARVLAHRESPIPSLMEQRPEVSPSLDAIFRRMVAKEPTDRFQSMSQVLGSIDGITLPTKTSLPSKFAIFSSVIAVGLLVLGYATGLFNRDEPPQNNTGESRFVDQGSANAPKAAVHSGPRQALAPFDAKQAQRLQREWAEHLSIDVAFTDKRTGIEFVLIPPGRFTMGSTDDEILNALEHVVDSQFERDCIESEQPKREVTIDQPFYIARTETTVDEFRKFIKASNYQTLAEKDPDIGFGLRNDRWTQEGGHYDWKSRGDHKPLPNHPVGNVTFVDATEFCRFYSQPLNGIHYRLPSEAEWEYACRAGTNTEWSFGNNKDDLQNFAVSRQSHASPAELVGSRKPNNFGLFDMHGSVTEWCSDVFDWHDEKLFDRVVGDYPHMANRNSIGVTRGGSAVSQPEKTRSAARYAAVRENFCISFRVVLEIEDGQRPDIRE